MISPDTPSGTEIVCVDAAAGPYGNGGLRQGAIYTVDQIARSIDGGHVVVLAEIRPWETFEPPWGVVDIGFELKRFRYLEIPRSLTELLETCPRELESAE
jgi:hypothetical protein